MLIHFASPFEALSDWNLISSELQSSRVGWQNQIANLVIVTKQSRSCRESTVVSSQHMHAVNRVSNLYLTCHTAGWRCGQWQDGFPACNSRQLDTRKRSASWKSTSLPSPLNILLKKVYVFMLSMKYHFLARTGCTGKHLTLSSPRLIWPHSSRWGYNRGVFVCRGMFETREFPHSSAYSHLTMSELSGLVWEHI